MLVLHLQTNLYVVSSNQFRPEAFEMSTSHGINFDLVECLVHSQYFCELKVGYILEFFFVNKIPGSHR